MTKTLQQIKDEVAQGSDFIRFPTFYNQTTISEYMIDQIAIRYAQEQNKELVEMLEQCELWIGNCNQYAPILKVIEQLINKHKGGK